MSEPRRRAPRQHRLGPAHLYDPDGHEVGFYTIEQHTGSRAQALSPSMIRARPPNAASATGAPSAPHQASAPQPASADHERSPGLRFS